MLDSFQPKDRLNPKLWKHRNGHWTLDPKVKKHLDAIVDEFKKTLKIPDLQVKEVILTGSNANYDWSEYSDLDVHLVVDYSQVDEDHDFVMNYFDAKKKLWTLNHNITIHDIPVEMYVQDASGDLFASGVYNLTRNEWDIEPQKGKFTIKALEVQKKARAFKHQIEDVIHKANSEDADEATAQMDAVWDRLKKMRQAGLKQGGESSVENLTFKYLRRDGTLDLLDKAESRIQDAKLSL